MIQTQELTNPIQIYISSEHVDLIEDIQSYFLNINVQIQANQHRFSNGLPLKVIVFLGASVLSGITYDIIKAGVLKIYEKYSNAQISIQDQFSNEYHISKSGEVKCLSFDQEELKSFVIGNIDDFFKNQINSKMKLKDIAKYVSDKEVVSKFNETNYISTENMIPNKGGVVRATTLPKSGKATVYKKNDILLSNIRSYFKKIWKANRDGGASADVLVIRSIDSGVVTQDYLYYALSDERFFNYVVKSSKGTKMPRGDKAAIMDYEIHVPSFAIQNQISNTLSNLDDKIELNNQINETLEAMAKAIFKEWFIDFGPVKAKAAGKQPFGMDTATAALFPDSFEPSELGPIPKGWRVGELRDFCTVTGGFAFKSSEFSEVGHPVVKIKNISDSMEVDLKDVDYVSKEVASTVPKFHLKDGSLVMAMTGATVGKFGLVLKASDLPPVLNQRVALLEPKDDNFGFLLSALLATNIYEQVVNRAEGSAQPNVSADGIMDAILILPPEELRLKFGSITNVLFDLWKAHKTESLTLQNTRDLLLPKLISGEISL